MKKIIFGFILGLCVSSVIVYGANKIVVAEYNNTKVVIDGKNVDLSSQPMISVSEEGSSGIRNYAPVRAIFEWLGYSVGWDEKSNTVIVDWLHQGGSVISEYSAPDSERNDNNIYMQVKEDSLTSIGARLVLTNNTDETYMFGEAFLLEKKNGDTWERVEHLEARYADGTEMPWGFLQVAYSVMGHSCTEINIDWLQLYGSLPPNEYRITKEITTGEYVNGQFSTKDEKNLSIEFLLK